MQTFIRSSPQPAAPAQWAGRSGSLLPASSEPSTAPAAATRAASPSKAADQGVSAARPRNQATTAGVSWR